MAWRIGVDPGDTFTGVCLFDDSTGRVAFWQVPSTPDDPARGIAQGIGEALSRAGADIADVATRLPVRPMPPAPSSGVVAARAFASLAAFADLITFDMSGASTAFALPAQSDATPPGRPAPAPEIHTVAAGGFSIARVGAGGTLQVGPCSAGTGPGPVCSGRGTADPTVTDAHIMLRTLNPEGLSGGRLPVDPELANRAVAELAGQLGIDPLPAAQGIASAVIAVIANAIRAIKLPNNPTLVAFGGAGPLHAARLARSLDIARILVPPRPGLLGALGKLLTDVRAEFCASAPIELGAEALPAIAEAFGLLRHRAAVWFAEERIPAEARRVTRSVDLRPAGQMQALTVPLPEGPVTAATLEALAGRFAAARQRLHGVMPGGGSPQIIACRVEAEGLLARPRFQPHQDAGPDAAAACTGSREVWLPEAGGWVKCPVYDRDRLTTGNRTAGPAIIEEMDATTLILPGMTARVDPYLSLILEGGE
jgi:N-methylhydantoinase A